MFENIAVFDIGSFSIKCIKAKTGFKNFQVESLIVEDLDFSIDNKLERITSGIDKILSQNDLTDYTVISTLSSNKLFFYTLNFPFKNIRQIGEVIGYEIADSIPLDMDSVIYDFQPIQTKSPEGMDVIAVVAQKTLIHQITEIFAKYNLNLAFIGVEFNSLFQSYNYFNTVQNESIIQLNIGYEKSIINLIINNSLCATRCILFGVKNIEDHFNKILTEHYGIHQFIVNHSFDLSSFENNIHYGLHKKLNISQQKFKTIFNDIQNEIDNLINEILLFINAETQKYENFSLQRIIISGGGALLTGFSTILSQQLQIPVVLQTLMDQTGDTEVQSQFYITFGTLIDYINRSKQKTIDLLKDEFQLSLSQQSKKNFYIALFYGSLSILFLVLFIILSLIYQLSSSSYYNRILEDRYKRYFLTNIVPDDPIKEATNRYATLKREIDSIESFLKIDDKMIEILNLLVSNFPYDANFDLNNMVINESIIRLDGSINSTAKIDEFKNRLVQTQKFESVVFNTNVMQNNVKFSMTIKFKSNKPKRQSTANED
ncbi:MAG: pilus assembly protein PilM [Spirochaetes bacterium]|nr:pilus assembly protein PilM [Spirochaetota bacterium]